MAALINTLTDEHAREICHSYGNRPDALLEILHEVQDAQGYLNDKALVTIADALNISRAEIHGVVSFYHDYRRAPGGEHHIQLCRAEACQATGSEALAAHAEESLSVQSGNSTADNMMRLSAVYCFGNCALGPAVMIDGELYGRVTEKKFDELVTNLKSGAS